MANSKMNQGIDIPMTNNFDHEFTAVEAEGLLQKSRLIGNSRVNDHSFDPSLTYPPTDTRRFDVEPGFNSLVPVPARGSSFPYGQAWYPLTGNNHDFVGGSHHFNDCGQSNLGNGLATHYPFYAHNQTIGSVQKPIMDNSLALRHRLELSPYDTARSSTGPHTDFNYSLLQISSNPVGYCEPNCIHQPALPASRFGNVPVDEEEEEEEKVERNEESNTPDKEEEVLVSNETETGKPTDSSPGQASSRASQSRWWPRQSDPHVVYPSIQQRRGELKDNTIELGTGEESGRNRLAIFQDVDEIPRLAFNIRLRGQGRVHWQGYPSPQGTCLPVGLSLAEILAMYPNHVWNDGLRIFMAEGWQAERMWSGLPADARNAGASTRQWNYLQQALGREADKIVKETTGRKRVPVRRAKKKEVGEQEEPDLEDQ